MSGLAGRLSERIAVHREGARDALGGVAGWTPIGEAWAGFAPAGGSARRGRWRVTMRVRDLVRGDRIVRGAVVMRVLAIVRDPAAPDRIVAEAEELA